MKHEEITVRDLKKYSITEIIYRYNGDFIFILMHPDSGRCGIYSQVKYITMTNPDEELTQIMPAFAARPMHDHVFLNARTYDLLELNILHTAEIIRKKCMYAKNAMTET